jgi:hypothetical protein
MIMVIMMTKMESKMYKIKRATGGWAREYRARYLVFWSRAKPVLMLDDDVGYYWAAIPVGNSTNYKSGDKIIKVKWNRRSK